MIEELARAFDEAGDPDSAARIATHSVVPGFADLAVLVLPLEGTPRVIVAGRDPELEQRASRLLSQAMPEVIRRATQDWQRGRQFQWVTRVFPGWPRRLGNAPALVRLMEELDVRSLVAVPLRAGGKILGGMGFALMGDGDRHYHAPDLALAQVVARRAALAIDKAELQKLTRNEQHRRSRLENALQKWIRVFDVAGWGAAIVDATDLRIDTVNPAFARMHGADLTESFIGQLYTSLLSPDRAGEPSQWSRGAHPLAYESVHLRVDGTTFPVFTNVTPLESALGAMSYVVTVQDVTDLKRAEDRLRRAQRMEAVGRLAGGVAHEVNNMMTIVLGFSDLLAAAADLPPHRHREVDEIRKAALRTARVTQQLLAFSRQQILEPDYLQLGDIVRETSAVMGHLLPANVRVETVVSPVATTVHADRAQIDQVLINLAFNARDAMPLGGTLRLQVESRHFDEADGRRVIGIPIPAGQYAVLSVSDTGHGMDQATLSQVFDPFFTTKPVGTGTGLGLATVYGIVKQSGGFVWVESEPGSGTTFTVCLPQVAGPVNLVQDQPVEDRGEPQAFGATVLVVEDEDGVRELARRILEVDGYVVLDVRTGADAVAVLRSDPCEVDLVLCDVIMPDLTAVELEEQIRGSRPGLPILYMSGYSREEILERGLVAPEQRFIQKPFTAGELAGVVAQELSGARGRGGTVTA